MTTISVLIAEDEPTVREALSDLVETEDDLEVVGMAENAERAVELARRFRPDVALLDVRMPGGGGPKAAREIQQWSPQTRVVALSAYEDRVTVLQMLRNGAVGYLVKGTAGQEILDTIRRSARGQGTLSSEVTADVVRELAGHLERQEMQTEDLHERTARIWNALNGEARSTVFQPVVDLTDGAIVGHEALTRFTVDPARSPDVWFAEAATVDLGIELELAAMEGALQYVDRFPDDSFLSVNVSPDCARSPHFASALEEEPVERLVLEVTEHAPIEDYEGMGETMQELRERGGRLAIDDAGAGFASLRHILRLAPDIIKLDVELTRDIDTDRPRRALAEALISFASDIGATVVAEGIETGGQLHALQDLGVKYGQGFYLAHPDNLAADGFVPERVLIPPDGR